MCTLLGSRRIELVGKNCVGQLKAMMHVVGFVTSTYKDPSDTAFCISRLRCPCGGIKMTKDVAALRKLPVGTAASDGPVIDSDWSKYELTLLQCSLCPQYSKYLLLPPAGDEQVPWISAPVREVMAIVEGAQGRP